MNDYAIKPPLGLLPAKYFYQWFFAEETKQGGVYFKYLVRFRKNAVKAAVRRYKKAGKDIPGEWMEELNQLIKNKTL